ncbi:phosphopantetheine-binding protein, partial [Kocuria oceani]
MKKLAETLPMPSIRTMPTVPSAPTVPPRSSPPSAPASEAPGADAPLERRLAALLASVVQRDDVPVDADFFGDLGADSLVMAKFCARVRKQPD